MREAVLEQGIFTPIERGKGEGQSKPGGLLINPFFDALYIYRCITIMRERVLVLCVRID